MIHHRMKNDTVAVTACPPLGGSMLEFSSCITGPWQEVYQNGVCDTPSIGRLALFAMLPWPGRRRNRLGGKGIVGRHEHSHSLHAVLRRTALEVKEANEKGIWMGGRLTDQPKLSLESELQVDMEVLLLDNGFEIGLDAINVGENECQVDGGLHEMCLKNPFGVEENVEIEFGATMWWPPAHDLEVPAGTLELLRSDLDRSKRGPMGPNWDLCVTGLTSKVVRKFWPKSGVVLTIEDLIGNCHALQLWHKELDDQSQPQQLCAAELQTCVADAINQSDRNAFPINLLSPGGNPTNKFRLRQRITIDRIAAR